MKAPAFWARGGTPPPGLALLSRIYAAATARRVSRPGWTAPVPVICCGNVTAGGAGKTPLALDLAQRLQARGRRVAFLTRGHGGRERGPLRVETNRHDYGDVGDEALLLAAVAPTFVGADRAGAARLAVESGAGVLVMDDGLQNPGLTKTLSLLVVDGMSGFGNGFVIPAGPLREPVAEAAARCQAAILMGEDEACAAAALPPGLPVLRARIAPEATDLAALPARLFAFAGIGLPEKFFATLRSNGFDLAGAQPFPDHHVYTTGDIADLHTRAMRTGAQLITTAKDYVRLSPVKRAGIARLRVHLAWDDPTCIEALLDRVAGA